MIEFEVKAPLSAAKLSKLRSRLGEPVRTERHRDFYYQHPARDFEATDEALRVRERDGACELTYKGPKLDAVTKTRIEHVTGATDPEALRAILDALGFKLVAEVRKTRDVHRVDGFTVAVDEVHDLGPFVEVERILPEGSDLAPVRAQADALLSTWGLKETERRSYLEMLLERARDESN